MRSHTLILVFVLVSLSHGLLAQEDPESNQQKVIFRPPQSPVVGQCYSVPYRAPFLVRYGSLMEIAYSYPWWACDIQTVTCTTDNKEIITPYKWHEVEVDCGIPDCPAMRAFYFKAIHDGECNISLTINGESYSYHVTVFHGG